MVIVNHRKIMVSNSALRIQRSLRRARTTYSSRPTYNRYGVPVMPMYRASINRVAAIQRLRRAYPFRGAIGSRRTIRTMVRSLPGRRTLRY